MIFKKQKKGVIFLAAMVLTTGVTSASFANSLPELKGGTKAYYNGSVQKLLDLESGVTFKPYGSTRCYNNISTKSNNIKLKSWAETSNGGNTSSSVAYTGIGEKTMFYNDIYEGNVKLNISTALDEYKTTWTSGSFEPTN